jgi:hypothetical protein
MIARPAVFPRTIVCFMALVEYALHDSHTKIRIGDTHD